MSDADSRPSPAGRSGRAHDVLDSSRRRALDALFAPRAVAVIGATERAGSVGRAVLENLGTFIGRVHPVNPKHTTLAGRPAFPSIGAVPGPVDLAVIVTPAPTVPGLLRECVAAGVPAAIIISAGFRETGPAGAALEQECLEIARRGRLRLLGPNCLGLMVPHARLNATFAAALAAPGNVAFLSQSGALCTAVLDWSIHEKVGFSAFVSVGSMLDVGWGDLITHFGDDPHTRSIVCYMESVGDARSFLSAAREVALNKPVIVLKVGRTEAASKAAASHTGALTGSDAVLDAAFRRAGVLRVNAISELFNLAELLAKQPRPRGPRLAIVTNAGGPGALATDALVAGGGQLASLSEATVTELNAFLPPHWSHGNPIDVLGDADAPRYARAIGLAAHEPQADGVLVILTPQAMTDAQGTAEAMGALKPPPGKPVLASWMGGPGVGAGRAALNAAGIPTLDYPDTAARAFALMWRYSDNLRALYETPALRADPAAEANRAEAAEVIAAVRRAGRTLLTEAESKRLLAAYGIPTVETRVATSLDEAVQHAVALGFPVAVKLHSETLTHKTDVGGVQLDLRDADAVRGAWDRIRATVTEKAGGEHFLGVTVQPMIPRDGHELILGSSIDPQFGPVILFGAGGQLVEVFQDRALGLPPLNGTLARRLMEQTKVFKALQGVRGQRPVDVGALEQLLVRFSELVAEQRWIAELDVNPLLALPGLLLALDARVVLHPADTREAELPRLAIRPYPVRYVTAWTLRDGSPVTIRPIRPEDEPLMVKFHATLSERSVYLRYFSPVKLDQRVAHDRLSRICFVDYDRELVLVAERRAPGAAGPEIIGVGRLSRQHELNEAEFAITVGDHWQRCGLGTQLLTLLVQAGRHENLERITAIMLADNLGMQRVARKLGFTLRHADEADEFHAELVL